MRRRIKDLAIWLEELKDVINYQDMDAFGKMISEVDSKEIADYIYILQRLVKSSKLGTETVNSYAAEELIIPALEYELQRRCNLIGS